MTNKLKFAVLTMLVGGGAWFAPAAKADESNKKTVVTFSEPVAIPGQVLSAGTYVFKLADDDSDRTIVQVFTQDQKHLLATILAVPAYREEPADKTIVTFDERPSGSPEALHNWFYPGENYGVEFVYAKSERHPALETEQPAPAPTQQVMMAEPPVEQPMGDFPEMMRVEEMIVAQAEPAAPANESAPTSLPESLPQTAGNFATIPLVGLALLSGGFTALRFATKQG